MAKFIDKKEQVFDLKLTTYGRQLLSVGSFKPTYYAFYDDSVLYDSQYAGTGVLEPQNDIHDRIKNKTQYFEGLTLFESVEDTLNNYSGPGYEIADSKKKIRKNVFRFDFSIGDAYLDGDANIAPGWKIVALQSNITTSAIKDTRNDINVPQVNINAFYNKKIKKFEPTLNPEGVRIFNLQTSQFVDNRVIVLEQTDPLIYVEELNTQMLTENFDLEVYEVVKTEVETLQGRPLIHKYLEKKYFEKTIPQIVDGIMVSPVQLKNETQAITTASVEYYFDVLVDYEVDQRIACKGAEVFNNESYYVNLDFDCKQSTGVTAYYDIYGSVTEPEICQY